MKETDISVFVDESGSFDSDDESSRFYLICLVVHDQREAIEGEVSESHQPKTSPITIGRLTD